MVHLFHLKKYIKQCSVSRNNIVLGLPIIESSYEKATEMMHKIVYSPYCLQHRVANKKRPYLNEFIQQKKYAIFSVRCSIETDIYYLYCSQDDSSFKQHGVCNIPDINTSNKKQYWTEGTEFKIKTPTLNYNKTELVKMYLDHGGLVENLNLTVSCYSDSSVHCGSCPSCFKRYIAFKNNDISFETANDPVEWASTNGIIEKCKDGTYAPGRSNEILSALS